jgi:hypothetical protein
VIAHHLQHREQAKGAYTAEQIDILAAYIVPADAWYVIPILAFTPEESLAFYRTFPDTGSTNNSAKLGSSWLAGATASLKTVSSCRLLAAIRLLRANRVRAVC